MAAKPEILDVVVFPPITSPENVFVPANVCAPVVTIPPLVPSAGAKLNTPDVMVAPFVVAVPIAPIEIEVGVVHVNVPLPVVVRI